jgi:hypothetical protein
MIRPEIPPSVRQPCNAPVAVPDRDLSEREAFSIMARDRASLRQCEAKRASAVAAVEGR